MATSTPTDGDTKSMSMGSKLGLLLVLGTLVLFTIPTVVMLCIGMLPTGVAAIVDRSLSRLSWLCVGGLNLAGLIPSLADLWQNANSVDLSLDLITDVWTLALVYGCAAAGWILYVSVPQILATFMALTAGHRVSHLKGQQNKLEEAWGPEVKDGAEEAVAEFMRRGRVSDFDKAGD